MESNHKEEVKRKKAKNQQKYRNDSQRCFDNEKKKKGMKLLR